MTQRMLMIFRERYISHITKELFDFNEQSQCFVIYICTFAYVKFFNLFFHFVARICCKRKKYSFLFKKNRKASKRYVAILARLLIAILCYALRNVEKRELERFKETIEFYTE